MEKTSQEPLVRLVLEAASAAPEGIVLKDVMSLLGLPTERRQAQRLLKSMVKDGRLHMTGTTRGARYFIATPKAQVTIPAGPTQEDYPPLSAASVFLREDIRKPLFQRTPVTYRREFLEAYRPNQDFYLPESTRAHLRNLGQPKVIEMKAGTYARQILERLLIDLSFNSSRLEGNTYSLLDTAQLVRAGQQPEGKDIKETQMILNHKAAIEYLVEQAEQINFNLHTLRNLHALLSENLVGDPADSGRLRVGAVGVSGTVYRPMEVPTQIEECFRQFLYIAQEIQDPFEQAFFALVHIPYLQPFIDVNKRTSRLAANIPFIRENLCPISFAGVPGEAYTDGILAIYELNRIELLRDVFIWAYERSCKEYKVVQQTLGEPDPFRLRYRDIIREVVQQIVKESRNPAQAQELLQRYASGVAQDDRIRFYAVVQTELNGLHEGNIVRYRLTEQEWLAWKAQWDREQEH